MDPGGEVVQNRWGDCDPAGCRGVEPAAGNTAHTDTGVYRAAQLT